MIKVDILNNQATSLFSLLQSPPLENTDFKGSCKWIASLFWHKIQKIELYGKSSEMTTWKQNRGGIGKSFVLFQMHIMHMPDYNLTVRVPHQPSKQDIDIYWVIIIWFINLSFSLQLLMGSCSSLVLDWTMKFPKNPVLISGFLLL